MPELPEVETIRRALQPAIVGRTVRRVTVRTRSVVAMPGDPLAGITRARQELPFAPLKKRLLLQGCTFDRLERRGKQLAIISAQGPAICVQLGMTGGLSLTDHARPHEHVVWTLDDGSRLAFSDARRFGIVGAHPGFDDLQEARWSMLGPDALTLRTPDLARACKNSRRAIKALLLDQQALAGVGNIYADEVLFDSGIHPLTPAGGLSRRRIIQLAGSIRRVLRAAIRSGGSSIRDFRSALDAKGDYQTRHQVYARDGKPCPRCGSVLERTTIAQRGTVFCPRCQTEGANLSHDVFHKGDLHHR